MNDEMFDGLFIKQTGWRREGGAGGCEGTFPVRDTDEEEEEGQDLLEV